MQLIPMTLFERIMFSILLGVLASIITFTMVSLVIEIDFVVAPLFFVPITPAIAMLVFYYTSKLNNRLACK